MEPDDKDSDNLQTPKKPSKGYGKRSIRQWIVIYIIIAAIIYGLIYLIFFYHSGTGSKGY